MQTREGLKRVSGGSSSSKNRVECGKLVSKKWYETSQKKVGTARDVWGGTGDGGSGRRAGIWRKISEMERMARYGWRWIGKGRRTTLGKVVCTDHSMWSLRAAPRLELAGKMVEEEGGDVTYDGVKEEMGVMGVANADTARGGLLRSHGLGWVGAGAGAGEHTGPL